MLIAPTRNPLINSNLNPRINSAINPLINSRLNPVLNAAINPVLNAVINPALNAAINPAFNAAINPVLNSAINPALNSAINPVLNAAINPNLTMNISGEYMFDWNTLSPVGIVVRATDIVKVLFASNLKWCGFVVKANSEVSVWFDNQMHRQGQWVANGTGGSNIYNVRSVVVGLTG